jgi:hypothetical protein
MQRACFTSHRATLRTAAELDSFLDGAEYVKRQGCLVGPFRASPGQDRRWLSLPALEAQQPVDQVLGLKVSSAYEWAPSEDGQLVADLWPFIEALVPMLLWYRHLAGETAIFVAPDGIRPRRGKAGPDLAWSRRIGEPLRRTSSLGLQARGAGNIGHDSRVAEWQPGQSSTILALAGTAMGGNP